MESPTSQYTKAFSDNNNNNDEIGSKSSRNKDKLTGDEDNNAAKKASILEDLKSTSKTPPVGREGKKLTVNALSGRGSKYWLAGMINGAVETAFGDSAADISLYPKHRTKGMKLKELEKPIEVSGFREKESATITHTVDIEMHFKPGILRATFYVCDTKSMIIGSDLLMDTSKNISLM